MAAGAHSPLATSSKAKRQVTPLTSLPSPIQSSNSTHRSSPSQVRLEFHQPTGLNARGELEGHSDSDDDKDEDDQDEDGAGSVPLPRAVGVQSDAGIDAGPTPTSPPNEADVENDVRIRDQDERCASHRDSLLQRRRIVVKKDWDDSEDEDDEDDEDEDDGTYETEGDERRRCQHGNETEDAAAELRSFHGSPRRQQRRAKAPDSYLKTFRPSAHRRRTWWRYLTNPAQPNSLSILHVTFNLFAASLHPSVLLATPFYFSRTGTSLGMAGLALVAILGGVGGGLWVVLARYVGGKKTVEAITGASFGRHSKYKVRIGKLVAGTMLSAYSTGSAFIAYFALADLLLQLFFYYSPRGISLHDRAFVNLFIGAIFTVPLIVVPLAKRTLIRVATGAALLLYPIIAIILFAKIYTWDPATEPAPYSGSDVKSSVSSGQRSANPLHPPSIWGPYSLLPLLTLSSSPLQILAHNRSLRRNPSARAHGAQRGSNVKAFLACQASQVSLVIGTIAAFGVGIGTEGIQNRLRWPVHPNLFTSLPHDDDLINFARLLFVLLLSTHLALCLAVGRSSWARLLKLMNLNPFRWSCHPDRTIGRILLDGPEGESAHNFADPEPNGNTPEGGSRGHQWGKLARTSLGGALLWGLVAFLAYFSGVGGIRRKEKEGEEARYVRASEILGLFGGGVAFVLPGAVWVLLFWVRRQREILGDSINTIGGVAASGWITWVKGPLGVLARRSSAAFGSTGAARAQYRPVPIWQGEVEIGNNDGAARPASANARGPIASEGACALGDGDATRILLARKERQLQKRNKECVFSTPTSVA